MNLSVQMKEELLVLVSRLPGLEAAKKAIEDEIAEIYRRVAAETGAAFPSSPQPQTQPDETYLGLDSLGRIKRRRNLSPEVKEQRRQSIALARQARLEKLRKAAKPTNESPS
jgi:hypothetical protein